MVFFLVELWQVRWQFWMVVRFLLETMSDSEATVSYEIAKTFLLAFCPKRQNTTMHIPLSK